MQSVWSFKFMFEFFHYYCVKDFLHLLSSVLLVSIFFFFLNNIIASVYHQGKAGLWNEFESVYSYAIFSNSLRMISANLFECLVEYICEAI